MGTWEERDSTTPLSAALSTLKRRGSTVLLVGTVAADVHQRACHRFLGDEAFAPRQRAAVLTGTNHHSAIEQYSTGSCSSATPPQITNYTSEERSAGQASPNTEQSIKSQPEPGSLIELKSTVIEALEDIENHSDNLSPAEVRVCFDSLLPIIDDNGHEAVIQLIYPVAQRIRSIRGMGHFHLPVDPELAIVEELAPMFDAMVELRMNRGVPQQRWHLRDVDTVSEWLPLD